MSTAPLIKEEIKTLIVSSPAFMHRGFIPEKYTCDGENINPPLIIEKIPESAKSLVLIVDDPDAPVRVWTHWLVWNIMPAKTIKEKSIPGVQGMTDFRSQRYKGPCPPKGLHQYHFRVYALDALLDLKPGASRHEVEKEMSSHVIAYGELTGMYEREERL